ncbi:DMT family transporter [Pseudooceanicola sp. C21-150M6]|uniref:DMT family transporter n=1 Tax=Pseudooceanicola sp. C21-150M6 TaxID=3434355 RepID=UPI003D7FF1CB
MRKDALDLPGVLGLLAITLILAGSQIVMKLTNEALSPVAQAAVRSVLALVLVGGWVLVRRIDLGDLRRQLWPGVLLGVLFTVEFIGIYTALDLTTVSRASIIFYTMPMHLALAAHFLIPGERLTGKKLLGLVCAFLGVAVVVMDRGGGQASLAGDLLAWLAAIGWAGIALTVRVTRMSEAPPEAHLLWQLGLSAVLLTVAAPFFGEMVREFRPVHLWLVAYQVVLVAGVSFLFWFRLLKVYPASSIASFAFLTPGLSVTLAWLVLGEVLHWNVLAGLALVSLGIVLINRRVGV